MKIEFDISMKDAALLADILKQAAFNEPNVNVRNAIGNMINEIEADSKVAHFLLAVIRDLFHKNHLTNGPIYPISDMRWGLGISKDFLQEPSGLTKMAHYILKVTVKKFKPATDSSKIKKVSNTLIKKCVTVYDLITLLQSYYEKIK